MISETTGAATLTLLALAAGVMVDGSGISVPVDGMTITGGGVGFAIILVVRGAFKRLDDLIDTFKEIAGHWIEHIKRIEDLHRTATKPKEDEH